MSSATPPTISISTVLDNPQMVGALPSDSTIPSGTLKALLIGVENTTADLEYGGYPSLHGPHKDVKAFSALLHETFDFAVEDIVVMIDDDSLPSGLQPTCENVFQQIENLVMDAQPGDHFFFHFSGHGTQRPVDNDERETDGMDECIVCLDGLIRDDDLNDLLIKPLPIGSFLLAIIDACHSGTVLDLPHDRCNEKMWRQLSPNQRNSTCCPVAEKVRPSRRTFSNGSTSDRLPSPITQTHRPSLGLLSVLETSESASIRESYCRTYSGSTTLVGSPTCENGPEGEFVQSPINVGSPLKGPYQCSGNCMRKASDTFTASASVICITPCNDSQLDWQDNSGDSSMSQNIIKFLKTNRKPSLRKLLTRVEDAFHDIKPKLHQSRAYQDYRQHTQFAGDQLVQITSSKPLKPDTSLTDWMPVSV